jgi:hypothetical protein
MKRPVLSRHGLEMNIRKDSHAVGRLTVVPSPRQGLSFGFIFVVVSFYCSSAAHQVDVKPTIVRTNQLIVETKIRPASQLTVRTSLALTAMMLDESETHKRGNDLLETLFH